MLFCQNVGYLEVDFGQIQGLKQGPRSLTGAFLTPQKSKNRFSAIGILFWVDLEKTSIFDHFWTIFGYETPQPPTPHPLQKLDFLT